MRAKPVRAILAALFFRGKGIDIMQALKIRAIFADKYIGCGAEVCGVSQRRAIGGIVHSRRSVAPAGTASFLDRAKAHLLQPKMTRRLFLERLPLTDCN
jgi:hypothetical protein